jgi:hypothetical protein
MRLFLIRCFLSLALPFRATRRLMGRVCWTSPVTLRKMGALVALLVIGFQGVPLLLRGFLQSIQGSRASITVHDILNPAGVVFTLIALWIMGRFLWQVFSPIWRHGKQLMVANKDIWDALSATQPSSAESLHLRTTLPEASTPSRQRRL